MSREDPHRVDPPVPAVCRVHRGEVGGAPDTGRECLWPFGWPGLLPFGAPCAVGSCNRVSSGMRTGRDLSAPIVHRGLFALPGFTWYRVGNNVARSLPALN